MKGHVKPDFSKLEKQWPSPFVARQDVGRFTGGLVTPKYLANLDSLGRGPEMRIRVGRKIGYPVKAFIAWLEDRSSVVSK
jgi:hypothetical protein